MSVAQGDTSQTQFMRDIVSSIWRHKWIVAGFVALGLVVGIVQLHRAPRTYTVSLRVASVAMEQSSSRAADRLGGLAALAGVALPSSGNGIGFELYQAGLTSRSAADVLARQPDFMQAMFAGEWDAANKRWREPRSMMRSIRQAFARLIGAPVTPWQPPDAAQVQEALNGLVTVQKSAASPIVVISIRVPNPIWGREFLAKLHRAVDGGLRDKSLDRANRYIDYLNQELAGTSTTDVRASLVATLIDQEKQRMLASSGLDYAADPLEPPVASRAPTSPSPMQVIGVYVLIFVVLGMAVAFLMSQFKIEPRDIVGRVAGRFRRPPATSAVPVDRWQVTPKS
ncbi:MAG TPA: hypothetical protein VHZ78_10220 [Rhizomicrobium sp.]|jgi:hypothetical protein|nr:hypothetical protein [Rhizomicrobium sp.]